MKLADIKPGDVVTRRLGFHGPTMELRVSAVSHTEIICGPWKFSRETGGEIDEDLGWDGNKTGGYIEHDDLDVSLRRGL